MELEHVLTIIAPRPTQTSHSTKMLIPCIRSRAILVPLGRSVLPKGSYPRQQRHGRVVANVSPGALDELSLERTHTVIDRPEETARHQLNRFRTYPA